MASTTLRLLGRAAIGFGLLLGCSTVAPTPATAEGIVITQDDVEPRARGARAAPRPSSTAPFAEGLLFEVRPPEGSARASVSPSYVFGTVHAGGPGLEIPELARTALLASDRYCMEALFDPAALMGMAGRMFLPAERSLSGMVGEATWAEVGPVLASSQLGPFADRVQPWVAWMILGVPADANLDALDLRLLAEAKAAGKGVCQLESLNGQLDAISSLSEADQISLLRGAARTYPQLSERFAEAIAIYRSRDLDALAALGEVPADTPASERGAATRLKAKLLDERNITMTDTILTRVDEGGSFVAVGAAHLGGPGGILARLVDAGYRVTRAW